MARAIWTGVISFGLVSIPVRLVTAVRPKEVHFRQFHRSDGGRIQSRRFCEKEGREVPYEEIVRGYETARDEYVLISDEELERLEPEKTRRIDVDRFVDLAEIDPIYFNASYYLSPGDQGEKPYRLLQEAMSQRRRRRALSSAGPWGPPGRRSRGARQRAAIYQVEIHKKLAISTACVIFALLGVRPVWQSSFPKLTAKCWMS